MATVTLDKRYAFTLIELLVVIVIIAILAAILFPVFGAAREKGRMTACVNNFKQISSAILQYEQDNDENLPYGYIPLAIKISGSCFDNKPGLATGTANTAYGNISAESADGWFWPQFVQGYVGANITVNGLSSYSGNSLFLCPDAPGYMLNSIWRVPVTSYSIVVGPTGVAGTVPNIMPFPCVDSTNFAGPPANISKLTHPATEALLTEAWFSPDTPSRVPEMYAKQQNLGYGAYHYVQDYFNFHQGGANVAFCDGHVKWYEQHVLGSNQNDMFVLSASDM